MRLVLLIIFIAGLTAAHADAKDTCVDCHKDEIFRVQNKVIYDYYYNWKDSIHDLSGVTCSDCHGGDPEKTDKDAAHRDHFLPLTTADKASFKEIPQRCGRCHDAVLRNFVESRHYKVLLEEETGPHCATCHGSVNVEVYYTTVVSRTCISCHNEYTKVLPEIVGEADKILHRINVSRIFKNWVSFHYADKEPEKVKEIMDLYKGIAESWHKFNFVRLDAESQDLLNKSKALVNRAMAEKRKEKK